MSRLTELCDAVATWIDAEMSPLASAIVERAYLTAARIESMTARHVYIFPAGETIGQASRGERLVSYRVAIVVAERYPDAGEPATDWVDSRVDWVQENVIDRCDFTQVALVISDTRAAVTDSIDTSVYDVSQMLSQKLFWSEITVSFLEVIDNPSED